jgi:hypothetical protein
MAFFNYLYHEIISFSHAEETIRFLSPVLFIDFMVGLSMMCTTVFQVAVVIIVVLNI